jgi:CheY-like chemotaxis protein
MTEGLVIDDNRQTADALVQMLGALGFKMRVTYSSTQAMETLRKGFVPRFICLDINMPGADGTEVLAFLKREPQLQKIPVIVITSDDQPETRNKVMKLGAAAMIIKPATIDVLEAALKQNKLLV